MANFLNKLLFNAGFIGSLFLWYMYLPIVVLNNKLMVITVAFTDAVNILIKYVSCKILCGQFISINRHILIYIGIHLSKPTYPDTY